jgi:hypothetical protein
VRDDGTILFYFTPSRTFIIDRDSTIATHAHEGRKGISALLIPFTCPSCEVSNELKVPHIFFYFNFGQFDPFRRFPLSTDLEANRKLHRQN